MRDHKALFRRLSEFQDAINLASDINRLEAEVRIIARSIGLTHFVCSYIKSPIEGHAGTLYGDAAEAWMLPILYNELYGPDGTHQERLRLALPVSWAEYADEGHRGTYERVLKETWAGIVQNGLIIPSRISDSEILLASFSGKDYRPSPETNGVLHSITIIAYNAAHAMHTDACVTH